MHPDVGCCRKGGGTLSCSCQLLLRPSLCRLLRGPTMMPLAEHVSLSHALCRCSGDGQGRAKLQAIDWRQIPAHKQEL